MAQQILIIGLGQFGMSLAQTLTEKGAEVLAVDVRKQLVQEAENFVAEAMLIDATDEEELARLEPAIKDACVCAIGDDSREASIICTALLRQMGAKVVISRANDRMHQRILKLVGAHEIINPEQEFGKRFANKLMYRNVIVDTKISDDLQLTEMSVQPFMVGKSLIELALPQKFGVMVAGIRHGDQGKVVQPNPRTPLQAEDHLIIVSQESAIPKLIKG